MAETQFHLLCPVETHKSLASITHEHNVIRSKTQLDRIGQEQTIICRQLFAGGLFSANEREEKNASNDKTQYSLHGDILFAVKTYHQGC